MAKSKSAGRRQAANNKPASRARPVSMPWVRVERGASVERWATLQGLAMLCGPITSPQVAGAMGLARSEEHTSELQSLMRISYAVFCLKKKKTKTSTTPTKHKDK